MAQVKIYTTNICQYCKAAKEFFKQNNVEYEEIDVTTDADKQKEMIDLSGQMGVPVITVDKEVVQGFDQAKLTELLGL